MLKKIILIVCLFVTLQQTLFAVYDPPCYSRDDPINQAGMNYSPYIPSEVRRITVRGIEYYHSDQGYNISNTEWSNLKTNLRSIFIPFKIDFEFDDIEQATSSTIDSYIEGMPSDGKLECNSSFVQWLSYRVNGSSDKKKLRILFIPATFQNRSEDDYLSERGSIFGEFDSRVLFFSADDVSDLPLAMAYYICAALGLYDVQANISGNGDYVGDTGTDPYPTDNLMYFISTSTNLTTGQKGRLHWALTNHDNLKPLIRESVLFRNLVDSQDEGYLYLDHNSSSLIASGSTRNLLDRDAHNITTLERQITKGTILHQLSHWKDKDYVIRTGKFRQSEDFDFNKYNPDWIAEFKSTTNVVLTSNIDINPELNDPWYDENNYFVPNADYPILLNENEALLPAEPIYTLRAPHYGIVDNNIYEFDHWYSPNGKASFDQNNVNNHESCGVVFNQSGAEVEAKYDMSDPINLHPDETITISAWDKLVIPAGANIQFTEGFTIDVEGKIKILGTADNPIQLTGSGKAADYDWLQFNPADTLVIVKTDNAEIDFKHVTIKNVKCGVYIDGEDISTVLNNTKFKNSNVGVFIDRIVDNSIEIDSAVFEDCDVGVSFSDGLAEANQTSTIKITNSVFTGDCDYSIWGFPQDDLSSYNSNVDLIICNCVFYDDNDIYLHLVGGDDYGDIDVVSYNNIFYSSYCALVAASSVDAGFNVAYNTSTLYMGNDVITSDPLLFDPENGNFNLTINSPCIDAGGDEFECQYLPEFDPDGTTPDIGAYYYDHIPGAPYLQSITWVNSHPKLTWTPPSDADIQKYLVSKTYTNPSGSNTWIIDVGLVTSWIDNGITFSKFGTTTATYKVKAVDNVDQESAYSISRSVRGIGPFWKPVVEELPDDYALHTAYPNPFNPTTTIQFDIPSETKVLIELYDLLGQKVCTLVQTNYQPGFHSVLWDGKNDNGSPMSAGTYFIKMVTKEYQKLVKCTLIK